MSKVRRNLVANFAGTFWTAALSLAFVPIYVRFLGVEAYGLIGLFAIIQSLSSLFDAGLSTTLNRELAYASGRHGEARGLRNLVVTLQTIYWLIAAAIGLAVAALAPVLANHWVTPVQFTVGEVTAALLLMAVNFALLWPTTLYTGGLQGLQRHVVLNWAVVILATVRGVGAIAVLAFYSPTIAAFFIWQIIVSAAHAAVLHILLWRSLPKELGARGSFSFPDLKRVWRFAAGMSGVTLLMIILTQVDKIVLSRVLPLDKFGYYVLAGVIAMTLGRMTTPLFSALFPRLTELVGKGASEDLIRTYHRGCRLASVLIIPLALTIAFFAREVLWAWSGDAAIVEGTYLLLAILIAGTGLNGLMVLPFAAQAAHGWTRLTILAQATAVVFLLPVVTFSAIRWGAVGGAMGWLSLNLGYVLFVPALMHRRILRGALGVWYMEDVGRPLAAATLAILLVRWITPGGLSRVSAAVAVVAASVITITAAALAAGMFQELKLWAGRDKNDVAVVHTS